MVVLALGIAASPSLAQEALDPVAACVRDNLIRYAPPDRAVVDQYLSLESACREKLEREGGAQVDVSPVGGAAAGDGGGGTGDGTPSSRDGDDGDVAGSGPGTASGSPGGGDEEARAPGAPGAPGEPRGGSRATVLAALDEADAAGPAGPGLLLQGPAWLLALVGGAVLATAVAAWLGARSRPR